LVEDPLPGPRDLNVETVVPTNVVADVADLDHHGLARQVRVGTAPIVPTGVMLLVQEEELIALAAVFVAIEAADAAHGGGRKAHGEAVVHEEGLVVRTARGRAASAD
jgi:hypothetical protein